MPRGFVPKSVLSGRDLRKFMRTVEDRDACIQYLQDSMPVEYAEVVTVKRYLWKRYGCRDAIATVRVG